MLVLVERSWGEDNVDNSETNLLLFVFHHLPKPQFNIQETLFRKAAELCLQKPQEIHLQSNSHYPREQIHQQQQSKVKRL